MVDGWQRRGACQLSRRGRGLSFPPPAGRAESPCWAAGRSAIPLRCQGPSRLTSWHRVPAATKAEARRGGEVGRGGSGRSCPPAPYPAPPLSRRRLAAAGFSQAAAPSPARERPSPTGGGALSGAASTRFLFGGHGAPPAGDLCICGGVGTLPTELGAAPVGTGELRGWRPGAGSCGAGCFAQGTRQRPRPAGGVASSGGLSPRPGACRRASSSRRCRYVDRANTTWPAKRQLVLQSAGNRGAGHAGPSQGNLSPGRGTVTGARAWQGKAVVQKEQRRQTRSYGNCSEDGKEAWHGWAGGAAAIDARRGRGRPLPRAPPSRPWAGGDEEERGVSCSLAANSGMPSSRSTLLRTSRRLPPGAKQKYRF